MSNYFSKFIKNFFIIFFPIFSYGIFGPTEIFFANYTSFGVVFNEFGWKFLFIGTILAIFITTLVTFLPIIIQKVILTSLAFLSVGGYIQIMCMNKGLDQIGATLEGYRPSIDTLIKNGILWFSVALIVTLIVILCKENWRKILFLISLILTGSQVVAYGTLFISAPANAFTYPESELLLSGEGQYSVSSEENIIIFILDTLPNHYFEIAMDEYPEIAFSLADFTYYNNTECNYFGTFPSIPHMITGHKFDPTMSIDTWLYDCWNNERTVQFYQELHDAGYEANIYLPDSILLSGTQSLELIKDSIDNLTTLNHNIIIDYPLLYETLLKMSCYRFMPDYFKSYFDVPNTQYASIVSYKNNVLNYSNSDYYADLVEKGLSSDSTSKQFIVQHLSGIHDLTNDENCLPVDNSNDISATIRGIWVMLDEYMRQLKALGIYDNSTIIILADHGSFDINTQSTFLIKEAHTTHKEMQVTNAPITLNELLPTVAKIATANHQYLGYTIYDFSENQKRERFYYVRYYSDEYPSVYQFEGENLSSFNSYLCYRYTGDRKAYSKAYYDNDSTIIIPMLESFY